MNGPSSPTAPIKKGPYKRGWTKDEHIRFLKGLQYHGKGSWKEISLIVGTRSPSQIQVHAHRYFLRQQQGNKNKRSIHDFTLDDLTELEGHHHQSNQPSMLQAASHVPYPQPSMEAINQQAQLANSQSYYIQSANNSPMFNNPQGAYLSYNPSQNYAASVSSYSTPYNNPPSSWNYTQSTQYATSFPNPVQGGMVITQHAATQSPQWSTQPYPNSGNYSNGSLYQNGVPSSFTHGTSGSYSNGLTYINGHQYNNGHQQYVSHNGHQNYANGGHQNYANSHQTYSSNGNPSTSYGNTSGQMDSYRLATIPQLIDAQHVQHISHQESSQEQQFRKEDREYIHHDYNKDLQGEKGLLLKDLPDIFLRSEIANEPIK